MARRRRSTLFVGALGLDALPAALASGADLVCIDLEDAVPPARKDEARERLVAGIGAREAPAGVQLVVRVNTPGTREGDADVRELLRSVPAVTAFMLPKVDTAEQVRSVAGAVRSARAPVELYAIIETAPGLEQCAGIARADERLTALFFGGFDLSTALGCSMAWEPLLYARSRVVHAAALAGIEVIDSPCAEVDDVAALRADCSRAKSLGMVGKAAKHASQVDAIRDAFTPTQTELERARRILALFRAAPTEPLVFEGKLVELPLIKRYERMLALG